MPRSIQITMYTVTEACQRLAELTGRPSPYTRARFYQIVKVHKPELTRTHYAEQDLQLLATGVKRPGRPPK